MRDNLVLARADAGEADLWDALTGRRRRQWVRALPAGLDTEVGSGGVALAPAQAQQLALARLVLADPHTLVLDEATSLLDPRAARHLERSLSAVLAGRTVIAIAHRLHTAHDADRIAVVEDGLITELGSHTSSWRRAAPTPRSGPPGATPTDRPPPSARQQPASGFDRFGQILQSNCRS